MPAGSGLGPGRCQQFLESTRLCGGRGRGRDRLLGHRGAFGRDQVPLTQAAHSRRMLVRRTGQPAGDPAERGDAQGGVDRDLLDHTGEARCEEPVTAGGPPRDQRGGQVDPAHRRTVDPGGEARVELHERELAMPAPDEFQLAAAGPPGVGDQIRQAVPQAVVQLGDFTGPCLAGDRDQGLRHENRVEEPAVQGGERNAALLAGHMPFQVPSTAPGVLDDAAQRQHLPGGVGPVRVVDLTLHPDAMRGPADEPVDGMPAGVGLGLRHTDAEPFGGFDGRLAHHVQRCLRRAQDLVVEAQLRREQPDLQVQAGDQQRIVGLQKAAHLLDPGLQMRPSPRRQAHQIIQDVRVQPRALRRIVQSDDPQPGPGEPQGAGHAQTRRRIGVTVHTADEDRAGLSRTAEGGHHRFRPGRIGGLTRRRVGFLHRLGFRGIPAYTH